jgi:hypothetical protein
MPCTFCGSSNHAMSACPWRKLTVARDWWLELPHGVRAMIVVLAVILIGLVALPARADVLITSNGQDSVRLYDTPCVNLAVLAHIHARYHDQMLRADAIVGGKPFDACWIVDGDSAHLMYEDGDQGLIPLTDFKPDGV